MMLFEKVIGASVKKKPIEFVGGYTEGFSACMEKTISLASLTGGIDTQPRENDIVVVVAGIVPNYSGSGYFPDIQSGYTALLETEVEDLYHISVKVAYKIMGSTPDTSLTLASGTINLNGGGSVSVLVFRNVDMQTPVDASLVYASAISTAIPNPPSISPISAGAFIVAGGAAGHNTGLTAIFTSSDLENFISSAGPSDKDATTGIGFVEWDAGAFDAAQFGFSGTSDTSCSSVGFALSLKPV